MNPTEWTALITAITALAAAIIYGVVKILEALTKALDQLRAMRKKVDAVHHETSPNSGQSMHDKVVLEIAPQVEQLVGIAADLSDRMAESEAAAAERRVEHDRRLDGLEKDMRGIRRDMGRIADDNRRLADVDHEDRERAQREHAEIRADVADVAAALKDHVAEVPAVVDAAKRQAIAELGLDRNP